LFEELFALVAIICRLEYRPPVLKVTRNMSFTDIRAQRQAKEAMSHVGSSSTPSGDDPTIEESTIAPAPLYGTLPPSVEVRSSEGNGRGIYAKERFKKGH
jgi:hypothetical protein